MIFHLDESARREFPFFFEAGALLRYLRNEDGWRMWTLLRRYEGHVELWHTSGAVACLRVDGDERIIEARLVEGDEARTLVRAHGAPLPPSAERAARRTLRRGVLVGPGIAALGGELGRRLFRVGHIPEGGGMSSLWRVEPEQSVLELGESAEGTIERFRWHAHGGAFDARARFRAGAGAAAAGPPADRVGRPPSPPTIDPSRTGQ